MRPQTITRQLDAADPDGIATSQTPGGAGSLTLDGVFASGGVATLDVQRQVLFTFVGDETARTFTVTGTDESGNVITEDVAGVNATTTSTALDFLTVTDITVDAATAAALTVGTSGVGGSIPVPLDYIQNPFSVSLGVIIDPADTVDVTVQFTLDDIRESTGPYTWFDHPDLTNVVANGDGTYIAPVIATRLLTNSGTDPATLRILTAGHTST